MVMKCHFCDNTDNLKSAVCQGHCPREQEHGTHICKTCYAKQPDASQKAIEEWDKTTYHWKPKYKELDVNKMMYDITHYYVDVLKYPVEKAEEIAKQKIREQQELRGIKPT